MLYAPPVHYAGVSGDGSTTSLTALPRGLSLLQGSTWAISCWTWLNSIAADDYRQILSINNGIAIGSGSSIDGIDWIRPGGGSNYRISLYFSEADSFEEYQSANLSLNTWHHLHVQRISNTQMQLYVNGVLSGALAHSAISALRAEATRFDMIGVWDTLTEPMNGRIANVKVWSGRFMSASEVRADAYSVEPHTLQNRWAWYPFPVGRARYLDYSGRNHHISTTRGNPGTTPAPVHRLIAPAARHRLFVLPWARTAGTTQNGAAVMRGAGRMSPLAALTYAASVAMRGAGRANAQPALNIAASAAVRGSGRENAAPSLNIASNVALRGAGRIAPGGTLNLNGASVVRGQGKANAQALLNIGASSRIVGASKFNTSPSLSIAALAVLRAQGRANADGSLQAAGAAMMMISRSRMNASALLNISAAAAMRAHGVMQPNGAMTATGAAALLVSRSKMNAGASLNIGGAAAMRSASKANVVAALTINQAATMRTASAMHVVPVLIIGASSTVRGYALMRANGSIAGVVATAIETLIMRDEPVMQVRDDMDMVMR
jgi:hypothetical protein